MNNIKPAFPKVKPKGVAAPAPKPRTFVPKAPSEKRVKLPFGEYVIAKDAPAQKKASVSKYLPLFQAMEIGEAIRCKPEETAKLSKAMNVYAKQFGIPARAQLTKNYNGTGEARVWLKGTE